MLDKNCEQPFEQLVGMLSMQVQLTEALMESLSSERGITRPNLFELRGSSRFRCNGECITTISDCSFIMPGQDLQAIAIVRDLSRKGFGIISHQQWYPEQAIELQLPNAVVFARVARARMLGPYCFEVGLIIAGHELNDE